MTERTPSGDAALRTALDTHLSPFAKGVHVLRDVVLKAGTNKTVPHGLDGPPQGWLATRIRAAATADAPREAKAPDRQAVYIVAAIDMTIDVLVW